MSFGRSLYQKQLTTVMGGPSGNQTHNPVIASANDKNKNLKNEESSVF